MFGLNRTQTYGLAVWGHAEPWCLFDSESEAFEAQKGHGGVVVRKTEVEFAWKPVTRKRDGISR